MGEMAAVDSSQASSMVAVMGLQGARAREEQLQIFYAVRTDLSRQMLAL